MSMTTRAAICREPGRPWEITDVELDEPKANEVRVRNVVHQFASRGAGGVKGGTVHAVSVSFDLQPGETSAWWEGPARASPRWPDGSVTTSPGNSTSRRSARRGRR